METRNIDEAGALKLLVQRIVDNARTAIPGVVQSFDAVTQTATVKPAIRKNVTIEDQKTTQDLPPILNVPVVFPYAQTQGFSLTLPVSVGDTVLIVVADRSCDNWKQLGGIQNTLEPTSSRTHNLTDAIAIVGLTPQPKVVGNYQTDGIELRNADRNVHAKLTDTTVELQAGLTKAILKTDGTAEILAPTSIKATSQFIQFNADTFEVNANFVLNGLLTGNSTGLGYNVFNGDWNHVGEFTIDGVDHNNHRHTETGTITKGPQN